ncbi:MAG: NAD(P)/FAD-dependent oxidoreductase [Parachlamydiaceae bacterium]|nr:NAD(P)/FAD-dependent oxidoreductase [Parachlamydiaceae bacterium]
MIKYVKILALVIGFAITLHSFAGSESPPGSAKELSQVYKVYPVAIIGAGAGGTMAVRRAILNNREVLLFTGAKKEMKRSRGHWVRKVDNIPGLDKYKRTLVELREETLDGIANGSFSHNLTVIEDSVTSIEKQDHVFRICDKEGNVYFARFVVLATGMMDEQPLIQDSIDSILSFANKQTIAYCLLCDGHLSYQKKVVVIGYSEDAAHGAILLSERYNPPKITMLTNGAKNNFSEKTLSLLKTKNIQIEEEPIEEVLGEQKGILTGFQLAFGKKIDAEIGFVALGIRPNNALALELGADVDERGLVLVDQNGESSVSNLFVIGDLRANSLKQIYTAWQHAVDSIQIIDRRIRANSGS